jgi:hypothetical protein
MKFAYFNPTVMAVDDIPADLFTLFRSMADQAHAHTELDDQGNPAISIRGGQQIQLLPNDFGLDITELKVYVETQCQAYIDSVSRVNNIQELSNFKPVLISAWTIKQSSGDYQALHSHEANISGNMYLDVPDLDLDSHSSDANIEFRLPVIKNPANFIFIDQWRFRPQTAKMIVFPSYIPHTVYPWQGEGSRTILAWDVKLVSKNS